MDAMVTARIPVEVKNQTAQVLRSIGATPTQLINAAYAYVLETGALPSVPTREENVASASASPIVKSLSAEQRDALLADLEAMTCAVPESFWEDATYRQILEEGRRADYEALA
ncbi:MAG: type II toxin-antitoxin system RelB/DinJ family antitoxin [Slackia sp.]|nr:type II toxin-antitoxin system RelB/DinJ family antitoxin [Slackia sp.]